MRRGVHVVADGSPVAQPERSDERARRYPPRLLTFVFPVEVTQVQPVGGGEIPRGPRVSQTKQGLAGGVVDVFLEGPQGAVAGQFR